eukprot:scaffold1184_cov132-Cylindrotheca_fusiformis.AAC.69
MDDLNLSNGDFDGDFADTSGLDSAEIDKLLSAGGNIGSFNMNDAELLNLMNQDRSSALSGSDNALAEVLNMTSDSSIDKLVSMPLVELDCSLEPDPFADSSVMNQNSVMNQMQNGSMNQFQNPHQSMPQRMQNRQADWNQQNQMQQQQMTMTPNPTPSGNIQQMVSPHENSGPRLFSPPPQRERQSSATVEELEQEKLKLLSKLNEISKRQSQINETSNVMPQGIGQEEMNQQQMMMMHQQLDSIQMQQNRQTPQGNHYQPQQQMTIQQMRGLQQQQQRVSQNPSLASAVAGMSVKDTGESPLTSFLRQKGASGGMPSVQTSGVRSSSASVFNSNQISKDTFNRRQAPDLSGAMDRSIATHAMIKKLAFKTDTASGRSGGRSGNATWGTDSGKSQGYRYSGILPKHASDGHLLRVSGLGMRGSKTSLSKDNLLYGLGRSKGRHSSQSKDSLHGLAKKGSSNRLSSNALNRDELGGSIPRKGRAGPSKYKFGVSGSVPQLGSFGQLAGVLGKTGDGGGNQQGNARW